MMRLEIAIDLIVPDNTAFTVLTALRQLGYTALERVERTEIVELEIDAPHAATEDLVAKVMRAEIMFNPNKHRLSYAPSSAPAAEGNGAAQWEALVVDRDDETSGLVTLLAGPFGLSGLKTLSRGVAWRLHEANGPAPKARIEWACRELLANPFSQVFHVRPAPARTVAATR
ncbi:MAG TPA: phosphoribosylformylglycinamidine synthase subunit PurS [Candidatus Eremiobacteraceae bacterium]|nr:phosphoribosylformylglycinamidine synthase subunit PurS [Candidatus Eremiobacteraceae bacterium]